MLQWAGNVTRIREMRNACRILVKINIENYIERYIRRRKDNKYIWRERFEDKGWK
jgi:hypothetical protein